LSQIVTCIMQSTNREDDVDMLIEDLMQAQGAITTNSDDIALIATNGTGREDPGAGAPVQSFGLSPPAEDAKSPMAIVPPLHAGEEGGGSGPITKGLTAKVRQDVAANILLAAAQALLIFSVSREEWAGIMTHVDRSRYQPLLCPQPSSIDQSTIMRVRVRVTTP